MTKYSRIHNLLQDQNGKIRDALCAHYITYMLFVDLYGRIIIYRIYDVKLKFRYL